MMDPATLGALIQAGAGVQKQLVGLGQFLFSGQKKAERGLRKEIEAIPEYAKAPSIMDYYQQARQRFGVSPTESALYKQQTQEAERAVATGLAGARGSRARMGVSTSLARVLSDAKLKARVAAEQEQNRRFGQLGSAAQMEAQQGLLADQRRLLKQQQRLSLAEAKAQGTAAIKRAGLTNIFGGMSDIGKAGAMMGGLNPYSGGTTTTG